MDTLTRVIIVNEEDRRQKPIAFPYNPKDLTIDKAVPWQPHPTAEAEAPILEFTSGGAKTLSVELLLDTYESRTSVKGLVGEIERLTTPTSINREDKKRPPMCTFIWGDFGKFHGVVESLQVKYTMFLATGAPCRAVVTLKIKQANQLLSAGQRPDQRRVAEAAGRDDIRDSL